MTDSSLIGEHLAYFKVTAKLGEGGMGAVYRAEDTRLNRQVALKLLPDELATDPERLARFRREAQVLASLNHPNIASIHGIEEQDGRQILVLELVEGEDLADLLKRGPLLADEVIDLAMQIAAGLETAHERGVIHRDLKPANVKITPEGIAKVLDFGLAKPYVEDSTISGVSQLATVTGDGLTREGLVMGTASYMSPEQARGRKVDQRADVWAFGCVLYEMLTGRRVFGGETTTDVLVSVVAGEPDWSLLPPGTPPGVRRLLRRCLQRDPRHRLRNLGDAVIELRDSSDPEAQVAAFDELSERPSAALVLWAVVGPLLGLVIGVLTWWFFAEHAPAVQRQRRDLTIVSGPVAVYGAYAPSLTASPDQRELVFSASNPSRLVRRIVDQLEPAPIPGTEGALAPFFSPDGRFVGFWADGKLKKVPVEGGAPVTLCETGHYFFGGEWTEDGFIYFSQPWVLDDGGTRVALVRIPSDGGAVELVAAAEPDNGRMVGLGWPASLPGGGRVLVTRWSATGDPPAIEVVSTVDGSRTTVAEGLQQARFLAGDHLLAGTPEGHVMAVSFDPESLDVGADATLVTRGVHRSHFGALHFTIGTDGAVYWVPEIGVTRPDELMWVDRSGSAIPASSHLRHYEAPRISSDGLVVVNIRSAHDTVNVWLLDPRRDTLRPLTTGIGEVRNPLWTADGRGVVFSVPLGNERLPAGIYLHHSEAQGEPVSLVTGPLKLPTSVSADGSRVSYQSIGAGSGWDIWHIGLKGESGAEAVLVAPFDQTEARFAPVESWIAFTANPSGRSEVYVRRIGGGGGEGQASPHGGVWPMWSSRGDELFYVGRDHMMSVRVGLDSSPSADRARELFPMDGYSTTFDVSEDGERFLMIRLGEEPAATGVNVTLDWRGDVAADRGS